MKKLLAVICLVGIATSANAAIELTGWNWQRSINAGTSSGFVHLTIPPEIFNESQATLNDLRVMDESKRLVPHLIHWGECRKLSTWSGNRPD